MVSLLIPWVFLRALIPLALLLSSLTVTVTEVGVTVTFVIYDRRQPSLPDQDSYIALGPNPNS
jgi:hypothetical protein